MHTKIWFFSSLMYEINFMFWKHFIRIFRKKTWNYEICIAITNLNLLYILYCLMRFQSDQKNSIIIVSTSYFRLHLASYFKCWLHRDMSSNRIYRREVFVCSFRVIIFSFFFFVDIPKSYYTNSTLAQGRKCSFPQGNRPDSCRVLRFHVLIWNIT